MAKNKKSVRLPSHILPMSYNLTIKPDLESFTFSGKEIIKIKLDKEVRKITLHSKDLDIETVKYINLSAQTGKSGEQFATKITYDIEKETATFYFKNKIKKGKSKLSIIFSGIIGNNLRGFYKSKYILDGKEKYIATTQFEATDARRAFPCFDEPAHKAIFEVSLIIPESHTAISNTLPINIKEHSAGYKIVSFAPTPIMSTYLLAFIVGEFEYIEGHAKGAKPANDFSRSGSSSSLIRGPEKSFGGDATVFKSTLVRVFTTPGKKHQAKFALDVAIKSLEFYNKYFDIPYPLPTLDLIAIPDFESGAMENWGAITFRETALLVDEENSSLSNKQWVALVVAHEIAHQWFGNLVTMNWWTDLWLNEGFASYIEYLAVDNIYQNWKLWNQFLILDHNVALNLDGLGNSHPIEIEVHHPNEINEIFDKISYSKGSSIIRMLAEYIGEDNFREGLRYYLKKHSYKNTETINLWEAFEKVSKKPIKKMMGTWTKQMGYPLVEVKSNKKYSEISQEKFFSSRVSKKKNKNKYLWQVPISYNNKKLLLEKKKIRIDEIIKSKINHNENSFIRMRYDSFILNEIKNEISNNHLSVIDRLGIIRDIFALAEGGYIKTDTAMEFALNYKGENEYIVWVEIATGINKIYNLISNEIYADKFKKYALSLFSPLAESIGFDKKEGEKHSDAFLRSLAISQSAFYGDKNVTNKAKMLFKNRKENPISADIRGAIYHIISSNGRLKEWKLFEKLYKEEKLHEEKDRYGYALTSFKNKSLLKKTLSFIMSDNVKGQDAPHLLAMVWQNINGKDLTWKFVKNNWKTILKKYGEGGHFLSRLLTPLGGHTKLNDLKDAKKFFEKNEAPGAERTLEQAYERIESNIAWLRDDKKIIKDWLNNYL